jgi:peptide/nickel transport system substrate-binding protein
VETRSPPRCLGQSSGRPRHSCSANAATPGTHPLWPRARQTASATQTARCSTATATRKPVEESLKRAGITLKVKTYKGADLWDKSLAIPAKRLEHQLAQSFWRLEYFGDNARQTIPPQYDGRLPPTVGANFSEYNNPAVNRLIDRALAEPDRDRRAAMWGELDQRIMRDAPLVPLVWENFSFQWASRVHGWVYDPSTISPDLTAVWLDPPSP